MNIDYADIIARANARKDALMRYEAAVKNLNEQLVASQLLVSAMTEYLAAEEALDAEAKAMVGNERHALTRWVGELRDTWRKFVYRYGMYSCDITPQQSLEHLLKQ